MLLIFNPSPLTDKIPGLELLSIFIEIEFKFETSIPFPAV